MSEHDLEKIGPSTYRLAQKGAMRVPGLIIATSSLLKEASAAIPTGHPM